MPGLLIPALMQEHLATALAASGAHVLTLDPLGHGRSDRPGAMSEYSIESFAGDAIALLDHLDIDEAVVGGTSLGANVTLEIAHEAPQRVRGMIIEMPVLENAMVASRDRVRTAARRPPLRRASDAIRSPRACAGSRAGSCRSGATWRWMWCGRIRCPSAALLKGLFFSHIAPYSAQRRAMTMPALVIGHHIDPVHPFSDAGVLTSELPNARLVEASNILELRFRPERLTAEIAGFVAECWSPRAMAKPRRQRRRTA